LLLANDGSGDDDEGTEETSHSFRVFFLCLGLLLPGRYREFLLCVCFMLLQMDLVARRESAAENSNTRKQKKERKRNERI
jgi:hypothetical protein